MTRRLVWLKRDLRLHDHAPLAAASEGPAAALWIIEPQWLSSPEFHPRQYAFARQCVAELRSQLAERGLTLIVRVGDALEVLQALHDRMGFTELLSHEETGPGWTYDRDRAVAAWCRSRGVAWREWAQHGVVRRLRSRSGWAARWAQRMEAAEVGSERLTGWGDAAGGGYDGPRGTRSVEPGPLPELRDLPVPAASHFAAHTEPTDADRPTGGEAAGLALLEDFVTGRASGYRRALSSPLTAQDGCSRLSAHLAFGSLSLRRVHQRTEAAIEVAQRMGDRTLAYGLRGFSGRLRWHCHFMQKLEDEPAIEFRHFARSCDGLRPGEDVPGAPAWGTTQDARLQAWREGRTGFPMVDACMRSLNATGWLNFRMRAMLVSFASDHLWLHWRPTGLHLARQFTDFEAGIHWSQMQMQSGTTGINTLRIYSPSKQAQDQDPQGEFIRRWVPELARVPLAQLARPWTMELSAQREAGCVIGRDYPEPVVDEQQALKAAKDVMYGHRRQDAAQAEADRIQARHGSRRSGLPQTGLGRQGTPPAHRAARTKRGGTPSPDNQLDLFGSPDMSPSGHEPG